MTKLWIPEDGKTLGYIAAALQGSKFGALNLYRWPAKAKYHEPAHVARVSGWGIKGRA